MKNSPPQQNTGHIPPTLTPAQLILAGLSLFLLGLYPLLGGGYDGLTLRKTWLLLAVCALAALGLLGAALGSQGKRPGSPPARPLGVGLCLGAWLLLSAISALASPYAGVDTLLGQGRSGGLAGQIFFLALAWAAWRWGGGLRPAYIVALALSTAIISALAWLQLAGLDPFDLYPLGYNYFDGDVLYAGTFLSTIGNTGQLGAFYCLALPLLLAAAANKPGWPRWLLLLLVAASVGVIVRGRLEAALLGLALGLPLALALLPQRTSRRWLALAAFALLLALGLLLAYLYQGPPQGSLWELSQLLHGEWDSSFGSMRLGIWQDGWRLFLARPWLGWGPGCFQGAYAWLNGPAAATVDAAHNEYLGYAAESGLFSLAAYMGALACALGRLFRQGGRGRCCGAALLCYAIQAAFSFPTLIVAPLFWLVWGLGLGESGDSGNAGNENRSFLETEL